ncbi:MAG: hypothetical protein ACREDM_05670 [Methylocella sp.]
MLKARMIGLLAGACLFGMASPAFAQPATVTEKLADFESASRELKELYASAKDKAAAEAVAAQIDAATKRQQAAQMAMEAAMQKLNPKSQQDEELMEGAYAEVQAAIQGVTDAQLKALESQAKASESQAAAEAQEK